MAADAMRQWSSTAGSSPSKRRRRHRRGFYRERANRAGRMRTRAADEGSDVDSIVGYEAAGDTDESEDR